MPRVFGWAQGSLSPAPPPAPVRPPLTVFLCRCYPNSSGSPLLLKQRSPTQHSSSVLVHEQNTAIASLLNQRRPADNRRGLPATAKQRNPLSFFRDMELPFSQAGRMLSLTLLQNKKRRPETIRGAARPRRMCQGSAPRTRGVLMEGLIRSHDSGLSVAAHNALLRVFQGFSMCNLHTSPLLGAG